MTKEFSPEPSEPEVPFSIVGTTVEKLRNIRQESGEEFIAQIRETTDTPPEELLGQASAELADRMRFLYRHPHLWKFLGGSSIKMEAERRAWPGWKTAEEDEYSMPPDTIVTPRLLPFHISIGGNEVAEIDEGFRFSTGIKEDHTTILTIKHEITVNDSVGSSTGYAVVVRPDGDVYVGGGPFEQYRREHAERPIEFPEEYYGLPLYAVKKGGEELA